MNIRKFLAFVLVMTLCLGCVIDAHAMLEPHRHMYGKWIITKQPTCKQNGVRTQTCTKCSHTVTETIPASSSYHSWGKWTTVTESTCQKKGQEKHVCSVCGKSETRKKDYLDHKYGAWTVTVQPTDSAAGTKSRVCSACGKKSTKSFYSDTTAAEGDKKTVAVWTLQQLLKDEGLLPDKVDGIFGKNTKKATTTFQKNQGLSQSGVGFPETISRLLLKRLDAISAGGDVYVWNNGLTATLVLDRGYGPAENGSHYVEKVCVAVTMSKDGKSATYHLPYPMTVVSDTEPCTPKFDGVCRYCGQTVHENTATQVVEMSTNGEVSNVILAVLLQNMGLYEGPVDGVDSADLTVAICVYQVQNSLPLTGLADEATLRSIAAYLTALADNSRILDRDYLLVLSPFAMYAEPMVETTMELTQSGSFDTTSELKGWEVHFGDSMMALSLPETEICKF